MAGENVWTVIVSGKGRYLANVEVERPDQANGGYATCWRMRSDFVSFSDHEINIWQRYVCKLHWLAR